MRSRIIIANAQAVLPDELLDNCHIYIERGIIKDIKTDCAGIHDDAEVIDAAGRFVLPGLIDLHSDAIEKEIEPRPNALFPVDLSFRELEKKLAGNGITTIFHSISFSEDEFGLRSVSMAEKVVGQIRKNAGNRSLIRNRIHLRFEITNIHAVDTVVSLIKNKMVDMLSFMDHTPGQGQFKFREDYERYLADKYGLSREKIQKLIDTRMARDRDIMQILTYLSTEALSCGIVLASHDDDSSQKVKVMKMLGATISEFPVNMEAARTACEAGMRVCVGAPNVLRGGSLTGNLRALDAIKEKSAHVLCSDYYPAALVHAIFKLVSEGVPLPEAVNMASLNPARAVGLDGELGSIEVGKKADIIVVDFSDNVPVVVSTIVEGHTVYKVDYRKEYSIHGR
jgi:alpha-D-ribose 1-methylphosphonate 5-triphosphate diphosphatase